MSYPNEWTQKEYLQNKKMLEKAGVKVALIDTILTPIEKADTITYNPFEMKSFPHGSVFVFYCDSGKTTLSRLGEYKEKFPEHHCISLKGGRSYWRKNMTIFDD
jgi:hypothetical protein